MHPLLGEIKARGRSFLNEARFFITGDCRIYYDALGDDVVECCNEQFADEKKPLWLNLGSWTGAQTYPDACVEMALRLGNAARLAPGKSVCDAGFGFGEQDFFWLKAFDVAHIRGFNVTPSQVAHAQQRAAAKGLTNRLQFEVGDATSLPLDDASVDAVVALESAFHFDTRDRFVSEAFRVLRPGGWLALADMLPKEGTDSRGLVARLIRRRLGIPEANMYDRHAYRKRLQTFGFGMCEVESIAEDVYPGMFTYMQMRRAGSTMRDISIGETQKASNRGQAFAHWETFGMTDYVIANAQKPESKAVAS